MRNLKKALSLALASVMLLGMMVVGTSAAGYPDVKGNDNQEAIEVLKLVGVMSGDDKGNFNPEKNVTRNEMAVIMVNLMDLKLNGSHPFTDVPTWADKYVAACYTNGVVSGTSATTYGGDDQLTAVQAALMVMKTLGYFEFPGEFGTDWKLATVKKATELKLFEEISASVDEKLTRAEAAQLVFNALQCKTVTAYEEGGMTVEGNGISVTQAAKYTHKEGDVLKTKLFPTLSAKGTDSDDLGRVTTYYTYKPEKGDEKTAEWAVEADYTVVVNKEYKTLKDLVDYVLKNSNKKLNADAAIAAGIKWNGSTITGAAALDTYIKDTCNEAGAIIELYVNEDDAKKVDAIVAYSYDIYEIEKIDTKVKEADADEGVKAYVTIKGLGKYNDDKIPGFAVANYAKGDYIAVCKNGSTLVDTYAPKIVEGVSLTSIASDKVSAKVGSDSYASAGAAKFGSAKVGSDNSYDLYLDANGYVMQVKAVKEAKKTLDDVVYVLNSFETETADDYGVKTKKAFVQVVDLDGVISNVQVEDKTIADGLKTKLVTFKSVKDKAYMAATEYSFTDDKDFDLAGSKFTGEIKSSTKQIVGAYLKADTQYVMIKTLDKDNKDLALGKITAEAKAGITGYNLTNAIVITAKDGTATVAKYVIVLDAKASAASYEDKLYVKDTSKYSVTEDGHVFTVYNNKGEKIEILCDESVTSLTEGFNTYEIKDGEYTLKGADPKTLTTADWSDKITGVYSNVSFASYYEGKLTIGASYKLSDIAAENAVVVDLVDDDVTIETLAELEVAVNDTDNATLKDVKVSLDIDKNGAVIIFIVAATEVE